MCCEPPEAGPLPPAVATMLDAYRERLAEHPGDWGEEFPGTPRGQDYARWLGPELVLAGGAADWPGVVREALPRRLPAGLVVVTVDDAGITLRSGAHPWRRPGAQVEIGVLLDNRCDVEALIEVGEDRVTLPPGGVELLTRSTGSGFRIGPVPVPAGEPAPAARLRLHAGAPSRWSVVDDRGTAWFPDGCLRKWDADGVPYFHGDDLEIEVPAVPVTVRCGRGMEFTTDVRTLRPGAGELLQVELDPQRWHDPAAHGWYGADLHVHMNYTGDLVITPDQAALMQRGEGLHLLNLVAGNVGGALVYDREAFEATVGQDLPWSGVGEVARFGVEFRNDLLGHLHGLGLESAPTRYSTGHEGTAHPHDWPPNSEACADLRARGATVTYAHPVFSPLADGTPAGAFGFPRSVEARELPADAALGLVDSVDLLGPSDAEGTALLYHHLLNCGLRPSVTAGSDVWLSFSRGPLISNPPGWVRVYAELRGEPLSVRAFQDAVRAGRTLATTGPWLELDVEGRGPGDVIAAAPGTALRVAVRATGPGVESVELIGPDGVLAAASGDIATVVDVETSTWLCAVARGPKHESVPGPVVFAHTSPVHVEVGGLRVVRAGSARWLLDWLDRLEHLVREHGHREHGPAGERQLSDVLAVLDRAREHYREVLVD